jgi:hypothetical protein
MKVSNNGLKFLVVLVIMFIGFSFLLGGAISSNERDALIALYNSTNGDNWTNNSGWKTPPLDNDGFAKPGTEDNWYGITVTDSKVKGIYLIDNQLSGTIPTEIGNLSNLRHLNLDSNKLSGNIPSELGNLTELHDLDLSDNQLMGSIPTSFTNLINMASGWLNLDYNGLYTDDDTLRDFLNSLDTDWEERQTIAPTSVTAAPLSTSSMAISWSPILYTDHTGGYRVYYSINSGGPWTYSGITAGKAASTYTVTGLSSGTTYYFIVKTQTNPHSSNYNTLVSEASEETSATTTSMPETGDPFGSFDTPVDGATVFGSIPVTGWALDESGIKNIKIYRNDGKNLIYIGDAITVEGARPDVAARYQEYPYSVKAGWGYMLLTNFLPNGGNGTFTLEAIATDNYDNSKSLGTKTILCDNANAVKPFGAIDTPSQGGTASGSSFVNWGWVLTPMPNSIPIDGSTMNVWVDGVSLGHPTYNLYRTDIATLFPGYNNTSGAIGYFYLDTTAFENGIHTIQWTVTDDAGNTDGIGSRYFTISNSDSSANDLLVNSKNFNSVTVSRISKDERPIKFKSGFLQKDQFKTLVPDRKGEFIITIKELELLEIKLETDPIEPSRPAILRAKAALPLHIHGYQWLGSRLANLPAGTSFNKKRSIFRWLPGPGHLGLYQFIFVLKDSRGNETARIISVHVKPRF